MRKKAPARSTRIALRILIVSFFWLAAGGLAVAATLSGTVTDTGGFGVPGVNIDVVDTATGDSIPLDSDTTDGNGDFAVTVPDNATYDIRLLPMIDDRLVPTIIRDVVVTTGTTNIGSVALDPGALLTGTVLRQDNNLPVASADTDVDISSTGESVFTPGDNTDDGGVFEVIVPLTTIDLAIEPAKTDRLVGRVVAEIVVAGDLDLGNLLVAPGALLSGTARRASNSAPVMDADTDTFDAVTDDKIPTAGDNTDDFGVFSVVVPFGTVNISIQPDQADRLVAKEVNDIVIAADTNIGDVFLDDGARVFGTLVRTNGGAPVEDADTDAADAFTGASITTPGDDSDGSGAFSAIVPFGTIDFSIEPRVSDRLVGVRIPDLDVIGDTNLGTISLDDGFLVSGTLTDPAPVSRASVRVFDAASGVRMSVRDSATASDGSYSFVVPAGTYVAKWSPRLGEGTGRRIEESLVVASDQNFDAVVPASPVSVTIGDTGHLAELGGQYRPVVSVVNNTGSPTQVKATIIANVPSRGITKTIIPAVTKGLPGSTRIVSKGIRIPMPNNLPPALLGIPVWVEVSVLDPGDDTLWDRDFVEFQIR